MSRFQFVEDHRDTYEVKRLCELVEIERSSYYAWRAAAPARAARAAADTELAGRIRAVHEQDNTLGAPRMTAELNDAAAAGERVNHKRVARVMRAERIRGYQKRRRVRTTIPQPSGQHVPDLLQRDFTAAAPNCRYVGDITYLPIADGSNLYLATVIDCYSRRLVGWSIADHMRTELVADALRNAAATRGGGQALRGAIFHSDHGWDAVDLGERVQAQPGFPQQRRDLPPAEAAVKEQVRQPLRVAGRHGQAAMRVAIRTASSRRAPPRAKIGWPKPRFGSTSTSATS